RAWQSRFERLAGAWSRWGQTRWPESRVPSPLAGEGQGEGFPATSKARVFSLWRRRRATPLPGPPPQGGRGSAAAPSEFQFRRREGGPPSFPNAIALSRQGEGRDDDGSPIVQRDECFPGFTSS